MVEKEYIKREEVLRHRRKMSSADFGGEFWDEAVLCEDILKIPAADVVEVRHGKWVPYEQPLGVGYSIPNYKPTHCCSHCKGLGWEFYATCPDCGAKMDGGK